MSALCNRYEYGERGVLTPGVIFAVRGGPYFEFPDGRRESMAEKGKFKFVSYDPRGWILARRIQDGIVGGISVLFVGKTRKSKQIDGFVTRGYRIRRPRGERSELVAVDDTAKKGCCSKHPTYRAVQRPRVPCPECIALWQEKNPGKPLVKPEPKFRRKRRKVA